MYNIRLAKEIYGHKPLLVDSATFSSLQSLLADLSNNVSLDTSGEKLNSLTVFDLKNEVLVVDDTYDLRSKAPDSELVYVINLNGPITKSGGMSSYGMKDLAADMLKFDADSRVKGGVMITDSGGGSSAGCEWMQFVMTQLTKPLVALVERAGCACSAAYGIISGCDYIFAESAESEVGSIGTMISFEGRPNKSLGGDGSKQVTIYATASTKKNKWFEEALNNDNYELAINEILDPFNERFMDSIKANRPNVKKTQLDGSVYNAGDVLGSLVDEIGDFTAAVNKVLELSSINPIAPNNATNKQTKNTAMTKAELQAQHPALYAEVFGDGKTAGVAAEKSRTNVWLAHIGTDQATVVTGIKSGEPISDEAREELLIKASAGAKLKSLQTDSAKTLVTPEADDKGAELTADDVAFNKIYGKYKITLNQIASN